MLGIFVPNDGDGPLIAIPTIEAGEAYRELNADNRDRILATIGANTYTLSPRLGYNQRILVGISR